MHVNSRAKENMERNRNILKDFEYIDDIPFINGNEVDGEAILNSRGIKTSTWLPYDGRNTPPVPGEYGVLISFLNMLEYIVEKDIDDLLLIEDDVTLNDNFINTLDLCIKDLPINYDFLSLAYPNEQNHVSDETDIGLEHIHRSYNQFAGNMATVFSKNGAKKIIKIIKRFGMEYNSDSIIFKNSAMKSLNGYSVKPSDTRLVTHSNTFKSIIDPDNKRETDNKII